MVVSKRNEDGVRFGGGEKGVVDVICMCVKPQVMEGVLKEVFFFFFFFFFFFLFVVLLGFIF